MSNISLLFMMAPRDVRPKHEKSVLKVPDVFLKGQKSPADHIRRVTRPPWYSLRIRRFACSFRGYELQSTRRLAVGGAECRLGTCWVRRLCLDIGDKIVDLLAQSELIALPFLDFAPRHQKTTHCGAVPAV